MSSEMAATVASCACRPRSASRFTRSPMFAATTKQPSSTRIPSSADQPMITSRVTMAEARVKMDMEPTTKTERYSCLAIMSPPISDDSMPGGAAPTRSHTALRSSRWQTAAVPR